MIRCMIAGILLHFALIASTSNIIIRQVVAQIITIRMSIRTYTASVLVICFTLNITCFVPTATHRMLKPTPSANRKFLDQDVSRVIILLFRSHKVDI